MYLLVTTTTNASLRRLLNSWVNPGRKHRRLPEGAVQKLNSGAYLFEEGGFSLDLLFYVKNREEENVKIFQVKELSYEELTYL